MPPPPLTTTQRTATLGPLCSVMGPLQGEENEPPPSHRFVMYARGGGSPTGESEAQSEPLTFPPQVDFAHVSSKSRGTLRMGLARGTVDVLPVREQRETIDVPQQLSSVHIGPLIRGGSR